MFLKRTVLAEPLVCNWYAWTHPDPADHSRSQHRRPLPGSSDLITDLASCGDSAKRRALMECAAFPHKLQRRLCSELIL